MAKDQEEYLVVHPLDDVLEKKVDTEALGSMALTPTIRWSLYVLRGYLILMLILVLYHVFVLAGWVK